MPPEDRRRARIDALFAEALELPEAERAAFLERAAAEDPALEREVVELLRLAACPAPSLAPDALAGSPLWGDLAGSAPPATADLRVGAWRLISELGSGGMGTVWLAERADGQYEQKAALKLLHAGPRAAALVERFERERQILANLDHPHIARLFDGGLDQGGRPWFAMEYVAGEPIDAYCDERALSVDARLRLFKQLARAVQAAHGNLVVHRDIKPSNVLVAREGYPRLLDFGIAKLLDARAGPEAATRTLLVLTPEYASPEQVRGEAAAVASDVYQLGLLLYEVLTGRRAQRLERQSPAELERVVCERTPPPPSTVVVDGDGAAAAARARRTTATHLSRTLRGDLDAIVMKALRKEPDRRYGTVAELVGDIDGYLRGLPVGARPETLRYRTTKFVRRHLVTVAAGVAFAVLLIAYAVTVTWQARQLARERDQVRVEATKAERVRDALVGLLETADPFGERDEPMTATGLAAAGADQILRELGDEPEIRAELLGILGGVFMQLAEPERAERPVVEALALQRRLHSRDHPDLAEALARYAMLLRLKGDWEAEERFTRDALEMYRRLYGGEHEAVAECLGQVAFMLLNRARYREAEEVFREAVELRGRLGLGGDRPTAYLLDGQGIALTRLGLLSEAEAAYKQALAIRRRLLAPDHLAISMVLGNLAVNLMHQGRFADAERLHRESLEIKRRVFGEDHPSVAFALAGLGDLMRATGRSAEAASYHAQALETRRRLLPASHYTIAESLHALAQLAHERGELGDAERLYGESLSMLRHSIPDGHWLIGRTALALGWLLLQQGRVEEAAPLLEEALTIHRATTGDEGYGTAEARTALGLLRAAQDRATDARALMEPGLERLRDYALAEPSMVDAATRALADSS